MIRDQVQTKRAIERALHELETDGIPMTVVEFARKAGISRAVLYKRDYRPFLKRLDAVTAAAAAPPDQPPTAPPGKKDPRIELAEVKRLFALHATKAEIRDLEYRERIEWLEAENDRLNRQLTAPASRATPAASDTSPD